MKRNMREIVFDIEADDLEAKVIWCLAYQEVEGTLGHVSGYDPIRSWLSDKELLIGHNIVSYDIPTLERILNVSLSRVVLIDTLALSWHLWDWLKSHGLETWGETFGVPKPAIKDWKSLELHEYIHRCKEDVKINMQLWLKQKKLLMWLYDGDYDAVIRLCKFLSFKMHCRHRAELNPIYIDKELVETNFNALLGITEFLKKGLSKIMPEHVKYATRNKPKVMTKKDGSMSALGKKFMQKLIDKGLPLDSLEYTEEVSREPGKASSPSQIKDWLFSLGWEPITFKEGKNGPVPQVKDGDELCESVKALAKGKPELQHLERLSVYSHRLGFMKSMIARARESEGKVPAGINGFTNTLRCRHVKPFANIPGVRDINNYRTLDNWADGVHIRGCMLPKPGYEFCGADMSSLENTIKLHYIYPYDPDYVAECLEPGYDPHLALALFAGAVTQEQADEYTSGRDKKTIHHIRHLYKTANYSCQYLVGPATMSKSLRISIQQARAIINAYWEKNWAIKKFSQEVYDRNVKKSKGREFIYNPISGFYYPFRGEKDVFSTIVQGTGAYCFDLWVKQMLEYPETYKLAAQFHDEVLLHTRPEERKRVKHVLKECIGKVNDIVKLNVELDVDIEFGSTYSHVH